MSRQSIFILAVTALFLGALGVWVGGLFTADETIGVVAAMGVALLVPQLVLGCQSWRSRGASWILLVLGMFMVVCSVWYMCEHTVWIKQSLQHPQFYSDDSRYFYWALSHYDGSVETPANTYNGFPVFMIVLWRIFGLSVVWPLAANVMITQLSVVLTAATAVRLLSRKTDAAPRTIACLTIGFTAVLAYFVSQGCVLQKEALLYMGFGLCAYAILGAADENLDMKRQIRDMGAFTLGCIIVAANRNVYLYMVAMGVVLYFIDYWPRRWPTAMLMATMMVVTFVLGNFWASYSVDSHLQIVEGGVLMEKEFVTSGSIRTYVEILGTYFHDPLWQRLLRVPEMSLIQYVIPFPWVKSDPVTLTSVVPRIRLGWYVIGSLAIFYYLLMSWRRKFTLGWSVWWPVLVFMATSYVTAGSVTRYVLPFQPLFAIVAVWVVLQLRQNASLRRPMVVWQSLYWVGMIAGLLWCCSLN